MEKPIIQFEDVCVTYKGMAPVLQKVNFAVDTGSYTYVRGASGAGKSTLLRLSYHGMLATNGNVKVFGEKMRELPRHRLPVFRRRMSVIFQDYRLLDHLTVEQNVALPLSVSGIGNDKRATKNVRELLDWVGLKDKLKHYPSALSGGEKQRAAIARAVITKPRLLLADEPTGNVDDNMGTRIMHLFEELNRTGTTLLIATHSEPLTKKFPHDVLKIKNGKVSHEKI